jgi:hypothetical protein
MIICSLSWSLLIKQQLLAVIVRIDINLPYARKGVTIDGVFKLYTQEVTF